MGFPIGPRILVPSSISSNCLLPVRIRPQISRESRSPVGQDDESEARRQWADVQSIEEFRGVQKEVGSERRVGSGLCFPAGARKGVRVPCTGSKTIGREGLPLQTLDRWRKQESTG